MVTDEQVATAIYPAQTFAGQLLVDGVLNVLIQELVANRYRLVIHPLVRLVGIKVCRTIVVELHLLGEGGCAQTDKRGQIRKSHLRFSFLLLFMPDRNARRCPGHIVAY